MNNRLNKLSEELGQKLLQHKWRVATAESCTGGGVAAAITKVPGSSAWFEYGVISYANAAKQKMLGVRASTLGREGAVSEAVVIEMAKGVLMLAMSDIAVAVSGVAGPGGGSLEKPVGTVWFAWVKATGETKTAVKRFRGGRRRVQNSAVKFAIQGLIGLLESCAGHGSNH